MSDDTKPSAVQPEPDTRELCVRCGDLDHDRRTLWMACFYAMHEDKGVPFEQCAINGVYCAKVGEKPLGFIKSTVPVYAEPKGDPRNFQFYTIRVCKDCRADWMVAIGEWFRNKPGAVVSPGTGIFVREKGRTFEVTEEEWRAKYGDREPVRYKP